MLTKPRNPTPVEASLEMELTDGTNQRKRRHEADLETPELYLYNNAQPQRATLVRGTANAKSHQLPQVQDLCHLMVMPPILSHCY